MSSATSIKRTVRQNAADAGEVRVPPSHVASSERTEAFRPWHFFVLASLIAATAAVIMSRDSTPGHLVLISLTIASAGFAAAGFHRMIAPLAADDAWTFSEPLTERTRRALEREKTLTLRSIKELEFDRAMGKLSDRDFDEMAGRLRARALSLMKELDAGPAGYRLLIERELAARLERRAGPAPAMPQGETVPAAGTCGSCGTINDEDAAFCKRCGTKLASGVAGDAGQTG